MMRKPTAPGSWDRAREGWEDRKRERRGATEGSFSDSGKYGIVNLSVGKDVYMRSREKATR